MRSPPRKERAGRPAPGSRRQTGRVQEHSAACQVLDPVRGHPAVVRVGPATYFGALGPRGCAVTTRPPDGANPPGQAVRPLPGGVAVEQAQAQGARVARTGRCGVDSEPGSAQDGQPGDVVGFRVGQEHAPYGGVPRPRSGRESRGGGQLRTDVGRGVEQPPVAGVAAQGDGLLGPRGQISVAGGRAERARAVPLWKPPPAAVPSRTTFKGAPLPAHETVPGGSSPLGGRDGGRGQLGRSSPGRRSGARRQGSVSRGSPAVRSTAPGPRRRTEHNSKAIVSSLDPPAVEVRPRLFGRPLGDPAPPPASRRPRRTPGR